MIFFKKKKDIDNDKQDYSEIIQLCKYFDNNFVLDVYKKFENQKQKNLIMSPYSSFVILSMLVNLTKDFDKLKALFNTINIEKINNNNKNLSSLIFGKSKDVICKSANSLWIDENIEIQNNITNAFENNFDIEIFKKNLIKSISSINKWVADKTANKITSLIDDLPKETIAILFNAIYFNGKWQEEFNKKHNDILKFYNSDGTISQTEFMSATSPKGGKYYRDGNIEGITLNYGKDEDFSILFLKGADIQTLLKNAIIWDFKKTRRKDYDKLYIAIPKFKTETTIDITDIYNTLGIDFDISKLCKNSRAIINQIIQKSCIEVDEKGTEVATVTGFTGFFGSTNYKKTTKFILDKPFVYIIKHNETGINLFVGVEQHFNQSKIIEKTSNEKQINTEFDEDMFNTTFKK